MRDKTLARLEGCLAYPNHSLSMVRAPFWPGQLSSYKHLGVPCRINLDPGALLWMTARVRNKHWGRERLSGRQFGLRVRTCTFCWEKSHPPFPFYHMSIFPILQPLGSGHNETRVLKMTDNRSFSCENNSWARHYKKSREATHWRTKQQHVFKACTGDKGS